MLSAGVAAMCACMSPRQGQLRDGRLWREATALRTPCSSACERWRMGLPAKGAAICLRASIA